jgi:uncharacterized coiled-coil protein SlyX
VEQYPNGDQEIDFAYAVRTQESSIAQLQDHVGQTGPVTDDVIHGLRRVRKELEEHESRQIASMPAPPPAQEVPQAASTPLPEPEPERETDPLEDLKALGLLTEPRKWTLGLAPNQKEYWQREFSLAQQLQAAALVGNVIDKAMSGAGGFSVGSLDELIDIRGGSDWTQANTILQQIARFTSFMPDFVEQAVCILLDIPIRNGEREWAREMMGHPKSLGGLSAEDAIEIFETAIDQNWDELEKLMGKATKARKRFEARRRVSQARRSKSSKR